MPESVAHTPRARARITEWLHSVSHVWFAFVAVCPRVAPKGAHKAVCICQEGWEDNDCAQASEFFASHTDRMRFCGVSRGCVSHREVRLCVAVACPPQPPCLSSLPSGAHSSGCSSSSWCSSAAMRPTKNTSLDRAKIPADSHASTQVSHTHTNKDERAGEEGPPGVFSLSFCPRVLRLSSDRRT